MGKKKRDHLAYNDDVVRSVILGVIVRTRCGIEKVFTREDFEDTAYYPTCKDCMAAAAEDAKPDVIRVNPKAGWAAIVERAWKDLYEAERPTLTAYKPTQWNITGTTTFTIPKAEQ